MTTRSSNQPLNGLVYSTCCIISFTQNTTVHNFDTALAHTVELNHLRPVVYGAPLIQSYLVLQLGLHFTGHWLITKP